MYVPRSTAPGFNRGDRRPGPPRSSVAAKCTLGLIGALCLALPGCGGQDSGSSDDAADQKPVSSPAVKKSKPLDRARKKLKDSGYTAETDDGSDDVADGLVVEDGKMSFHVVAYRDVAAGDAGYRSLQAVSRKSPNQLKIIRDTERPERLAWAAVEAPAKLPVDRFSKLAQIAIATDPVDIAKLETHQDTPAPKKAKEPAQPAEPPSESGGQIAVPDVVGHNHQAAQNEMQAAGLYNLDEEDCTGQGRLLIYDRNWQVERQSPPAGSAVSEDATVTLCSKKIGE